MVLEKQAVFIVRNARNAEIHFVDLKYCVKVYVQLLANIKMLSREQLRINVTLRLVHMTIVAVHMQEVLNIPTVCL
jgi:hypothetical protein